MVLHKNDKIFYRKNNNGLNLEKEVLLYKNNSPVYAISDVIEINSDGDLGFVISSYDSIFLLIESNGEFAKVKSAKNPETYFGQILLFDLKQRF